MPHRNNVFPITATYLVLGIIALTLYLAGQVSDGKGAPAPETVEYQAGPQSKVPIRARDYVDDYAQLNALRKGVVILLSGVQYEVLHAGSGKQPSASDTVTVHYRAMLANGVEFDNTYEQGEPASLDLDQYLVPGLKEALLLMKEGDEWRVTIPAKMGFSGGRFLRKRDLIYEIVLITVNGAPNDPDVRGQTSDGQTSDIRQ